ncbi:reprolysin-like metallopeptidase [Ornithobacterium rhinotracheale]|uniref:Regulatory P domain of subtilisin-like proprotein convertases n=1 Tax=Ornithobacterium rhinotracheale (strain ATCC 51463 / DSM 15997 / CCUG 23171 / CIP 104009 / LMG 9086) TaxID=867902 RepID=I4A1C0_ORNRL|nr:zinc-dependent metalloprotease family protein [Ornithobacterium rhinotracheale]AFL97754.1 regulatory P domain of subtilisin-like proprotein convertases [Ornithobacterium rhinotracheale DSM 15997]AIP99594.1 secretion protein [Ornithobacterium rhinotracheale ORT-UMN 88]KGB66773.1 hypothetical protein Q787_07720 [Ornithobacterium rhinotracheale H06-030791]MBN3662612.1 T9SS type A sorting domain-containing protein [Ornithobacterium rhinotracheale]MCK0193947.1 M12 family metallo-peptidase [Ornit
MKNRFLYIFILFPLVAFAQQYWQASTPKNHEIQKAYHLDLMALQKNIQQKAEVQIPTKNGDFTKYKLVENSNFSPELAKKYPHIKSYIGYANGSQLRLSISPQKIDALVIHDKGGITTLAKNKNSYSTYAVNHNKLNFDFNCLTPEATNVLPPAISELPLKTDGKRRVYRTAIAVTGEYTQYHGGTKEKALAAINTSLTHVNAVLEKELSVHLELIPDEDKIIFTEAKTDPFSEAKTGVKNGTWGRELQEVLDKKIGNENYDLGHLLGASFGGGLSIDIGTVCVNGKKGSAFTAPYDAKPEGLNFDVDFLTHEIGHQLGATHIFSKKELPREESYVEPGSGSTIMGYAGIVNEDGGKFNVQSRSDNYFNQVSIFQMSYVLGKKNCGKITDSPTQPPVADAGEDYTIPAKTPFVLKGEAEGSNKEDYTYTWEQLNSSQSLNYTNADANSKTDPLFRSVKPSKEKERMFPSWNLIKKQMLTDAPFESLSNVARSLKFGFVVRDGRDYGQVATDHMTVNVQASDTGFSVVKPKAYETVAKGGELKVEWNIAKTNIAPINVSKVNIYLVTDQAGKMQKTLVKENASNDGEETVQLPTDFEAKQAYILIESVGNIFFAVSQPFSVGYKAYNVCKNYYPNEKLPLAIADGATASNLNFQEYTKITFPVSEEGLISYVKLKLGIEHQRMRDLQAYLISPSGEMAEIFTKPCSENDNANYINAEISDKASVMKCTESVQDFKPQVPFATFNGVSQKGEWKLLVGDGIKPYQGKITTANLNLCAVVFSSLLPERASNKHVELYPSPAHRNVNVKISNLTKPGVKFKIYNLVGQLIKQDEDYTQTGNFIKKINIIGIPPGVYILQAEGNDFLESIKFIIE